MEDAIFIKKLTHFGFKQVTGKQIIQLNPNRGDTKEQWQYNAVCFTITEKEHDIYYFFYDADAPAFTLSVKDSRDLEDVLHHISEGLSVIDILRLIQKHRSEEVKRLQERAGKKPLLEDFRYNDIGGSFFRLPKQSHQKVFMPYERHSTVAFYYSINDIGSLENASSFVHTGNQSHSAISFWYLTLESYINTLIKICCLKKDLQFDRFKKQDLHTRLSSLVQLLELDIKTFNQNRAITKVHEFATFRNDLFHDRHFGNKLSFHHTAFSPIPIFSCQVDVMQSFLIVLEATSLLRYTIKGLDTMPSVILFNPDYAIWEKIDVAYQKIIEPYFRSVLAKHNLDTALDFAPKHHSPFISEVFGRCGMSYSG
jgi:hypothetical protein